MQLEGREEEEEEEEEGGGVRACGLSLKRGGGGGKETMAIHTIKGKTREEGGFYVLNTTK